MSLPRIRYLRTTDGTQLAWAESGTGPVLVRTGSWMNHLEDDSQSPVWGHWADFFSRHFGYIRYDERGWGMSDHNLADLSVERAAMDLEAVIEAAAGPRPVILLGISHGAATAVALAARRPDRVERMILYGGYALGWARRQDPVGLRHYEAIIELVRSGWGKSNSAFRRVYTSRLLPRATEAQIVWFDELCKKATSGDAAAALMEARGEVDVSELLPDINVPTLVVHSRSDETVPIGQGRLLASSIPNAQFLELESADHILLASEPAWPQFCDAVVDFSGLGARSGDNPAFSTLSRREREILTLVSEGLGNHEIAEQLEISQKTVRNHMSNLYDKLGVWTRAQAIVFARDHQFVGVRSVGLE